MTTITESDLKELKDLIQAQTSQLNTLSQTQTERFEILSKEINELKVSNGKIEAILQTQQPLMPKIPDLIEKVGELKNWKQVSLVIITSFVSSVFSGLIGGVIGWLIRGGTINQ